MTLIMDLFCSLTGAMNEAKKRKIATEAKSENEKKQKKFQATNIVTYSNVNFHQTLSERPHFNSHHISRYGYELKLTACNNISNTLF